MFKIGDKVKIVYQRSTESRELQNTIGIIAELTPDTHYASNDGGAVKVRLDNRMVHIWLDEIELINKNMNLKEKLILLVTPEPMKSRRKAGITDGDDYPTDDGVKAILSWWLKNSPDAKAFDEQVVQPIVAELEKEK